MNADDNTKETLSFLPLLFFLIYLTLSGKTVTTKATDAETRRAEV